MIVEKLLWLWQVIQNIIALILIKVIYTSDNCCYAHYRYGKTNLYFVICRNCYIDDFTMGDYIFISSDNWLSGDIKIRHSYGYVLTSRIFGPLWLFVIFIPRLVYAFYDPMGYYLEGYYTESLARKLSNKKKRKPSFSYK